MTHGWGITRKEGIPSGITPQTCHCRGNDGVHVVIVRYDAFEDIGGEQSFALSLIDSQNSGMVLSSVLGRNHVGVYAKALSNGKPSHPLTQEEIRALRESEALP